jgi:hypothetical protein
MTSEVKSWSRIFYIVFLPLAFVIGRDGASKTRRLILLLAVDWRPPDLCPSGAGLVLGTRVSCRLLTPTRATPHRGCVSSDGRLTRYDHCVKAAHSLCLGYQWHVLGNSPPQRAAFPRDGHDHLVGCFPGALSCRSRVHSRSWAFQLMSWMGLGTFSRRSWRGRLTLAG